MTGGPVERINHRRIRRQTELRVRTARPIRTVGSGTISRQCRIIGIIGIGIIGNSTEPTRL